MSAQFKAQLKWVAENVSAIHTLKDEPSKGKCQIEIIAWIDDDHDQEAFHGYGPTVWDAFIRALNNAREFEVHLKLKANPKRRRRR
jgi:hypothetical protein